MRDSALALPLDFKSLDCCNTLACITKNIVLLCLSTLTLSSYCLSYMQFSKNINILYNRKSLYDSAYASPFGGDNRS